MQDRRYENYIPGHLDDPKYVGNIEMNSVIIVAMTLFFFVILFFQGQKLLSLIVLLSGILFLKYKAQLGAFLDGWIYWHFGVSKIASKKVKEFGVVPTYVKDFEE